MGLSTEMAAELAWLKTLGEVATPQRAFGVKTPSTNFHREPTFDLADALESGLGPGPTSIYVDPPSSEQRLVVQQAPKNKGFLLTTPGGEPMLLARACKNGTGYDILPGHLGGEEDVQPLFSLQSNKEKTRWSLLSSKCERCQANNRADCGQQLLARMTHYMEKNGDTSAKCMDVQVPNVCHDGSVEVLCNVCGNSMSNENTRHLSTRRPKWNAQLKRMVLGFNGRVKLPSAKNFQLETVDEEPSVVKLLFGKVAEKKFVLDHQGPLGTVQAFAVAVSASHWD